MTQVLVSVTAVEPQKTKLCKIIEENFPSACLTPIGRKYFNDAIGLNYIKQYGLEEDSAALILGLTSKYYCLASTAAVLKYVEGVQNIIFTNHSVKFKYQGVEGTMMIDISPFIHTDCVTARNLELIANITNPKSSHSLYGKPPGNQILALFVLDTMLVIVVFILCPHRYPKPDRYANGSRSLYTNHVFELDKDESARVMGGMFYKRLHSRTKFDIKRELYAHMTQFSDQVTINTRLDSVEGNVLLGPVSNEIFSRHRPLDISCKSSQLCVYILIKIPRRPSVQQSEHNINHAIMLKHTLKSIKPLVAALGSCQNALLVAVRKVCAIFVAIFDSNVWQDGRLRCPRLEIQLK
ncbi:hypothetical protein BC938DRAFT_482923 [Jimgerdemannia flammicorona]|uniref:Uncharacterized protein n=1 Tax=Jimgerdemannia flammicorona TaxID=994334 RepID=A0A433QCZ1_9FUNG|nr:hypothetical protein BC938DRAFT_482923 [Jimgerdemannia flammicorona]